MSYGEFPRVAGNPAARSAPRHSPDQRGGTPNAGARSALGTCSEVACDVVTGQEMMMITAQTRIGANRTLRRSVSN